MAMEPHPDFAAVNLPRNVALGRYHLTPLTHAHVDEDYTAVLSTAPLLRDFFGDWPEGLTREDNLIDLTWHDREFTTKRSFSWIIRDTAGTYMGCFYLSPLLGTCGRCQADMWLCDMSDRTSVARDLKSALTAWLADMIPAHIALNWATSPKLE